MLTPCTHSPSPSLVRGPVSLQLLYVSDVVFWQVISMYINGVWYYMCMYMCMYTVAWFVVASYYIHVCPPGVGKGLVNYYLVSTILANCADVIILL